MARPQSHVIVMFMTLALAIRSSTSADEPREIPVDSVIARFAIFDDGDAIVLPGQVNSKAASFAIATGTSMTCVDASFEIGKPTVTRQVQVEEGTKEICFYSTPELSIGSLNLTKSISSVAKTDFKTAREGLGLEVNALLGWDFLSQNIVRIDHDNCELLFLSKLPAMSVEPLQLSGYSRGPCVSIEIAKDTQVLALIATHAVASCSGSIDSDLARRMLMSGDATIVGRGLAGGLTRDRHIDKVRFESLTVGKHVVAKPIFGIDRETALGMGFLSRFNVTFDFPNNRMYLEDRKKHKPDDQVNATGIALRSKDGVIVIDQIDAKSAADRADIRNGDEIVSIDGQDVACLFTAPWIDVGGFCGGGVS